MKNFPQTSWVFLAVLMELIALGVIIPISPYLAREFGADPLEVGLLMSIYSVFQCIFSPLWGKLSDSWGRRPVLLVSMLCTCLSYVWFAFAPSLVHLFLSRAFAGIFGASVSTSFAFMSDLTKQKNRSKTMALVGAAFGIGFIVGPGIGGILSRFQVTGFSLPALGAVMVCFLGLFISLFKVKESRFKNKETTKNISLFSKNFYQIAFEPTLIKSLFIFLLLSLSLTLVESNLFLLVKDHFHWPQGAASFGFSYIGFVLALTQGFFVRQLIPKFGEKFINKWGFFFLALGLFSLSVPRIEVLVLGVTLLSLGFGLSYTSLTGMISLSAQKDHQGGALGIHQSLSSLSRILGPGIGGWLYRDISIEAPFIAAGVLAFLGLFFSYLFRKVLPDSLFLKKEDLKIKNFSYSLEKYIEIEGLQLNNLIKNRVPFSFFCLEEDNKNMSKKIFSEHKKDSSDFFSPEELLKKSSLVSEKELMRKIFSKPVVLMCADGAVSKKIALELSKKYENIFYLKGGLSEYKEKYLKGLLI